MKKIGILTFFEADNYGALLQCYALSHYCKKNNNIVKIIRYNSTKMFSLKYQLKKFFFKSKQQMRFIKNRKKYFKTGTIEESYDLVIVGSDQVWNPQIIKGDKFWINPQIKYNNLISYAASFGKNDLNEEESTWFRKLNFDTYQGISVREQQGQKILGDLGIPSELVCDPTLLYYNDSSIFDSLSVDSNLTIEYDYIFLYSLEYSVELENIAQNLSEKSGLKVLACHPANDNHFLNSDFIMNTDITDFLYLISNAKYVVTNSFHGLAFSFIFRKEVYCICHSLYGIRQRNLIEFSGMGYLKLSDTAYYINNYENDKYLLQYIEDSKRYIDKFI